MKQILDIESKNALVKYRLERASETMKEAALLSREGYFNAAINRLYYACYYAVISLLLKNDLQAQSHAGVKTMFGLHFVSSGIVPIEIGKTLSTLFEKRQSGDYDDFVLCTKEDVAALTDQAYSFIEYIKSLVEEE